MEKDQFNILIDKYLDESIQEEEKQQLAALLQDPANMQLLDNLLLELLSKRTYEQEPDKIIKNSINQYLNSHISVVEKPMVRPLTNSRKWRWAWAAAILILAIGSGIYFLNNQSHKSEKSPQITVQTKVQDIAPGTDKAIWTLADGKQIELDSTVLDMTSKPVNNIGYNELRTPRGGQYQLILPDGSKVWLNAASSIKYPVVFNGKERRVDITGEAYFEIEKDAHRPFKVYGGGQEIEVLGTAFNVNIYDDESVKKTTLVSGSIKVTTHNQVAVLKPGQRTNLLIIPITKIKQITVQTTNIEQDLAWKNGYFSLEDITLVQLMKQFERWYNISIVYDKPIPHERLSGKMDRNITLQDALAGLEGVVAHFTIDGQTVHIRPL